ncbi:MAG: fumarylacetoacetase [Bacteroidia bacterium]|nr:fumarylacetoacetase [Bacteroidia bacterium]
MENPNDPTLRSWVDIPSDSDFSLQNLPFGICKIRRQGKRAVSAIGQYIIDLAALHELRYFDDLNLPQGIFEHGSLNPFIELGPTAWRAVRKRLSDLLRADKSGALRNYPDSQAQVLLPMQDVEMRMPVKVRDYTDFYASEQHATNVGTMFRGADNALPPNWKHMPIGYHGRASSIVISGTPIRRPHGQLKPTEGSPVLGSTRRLDFELELAAVMGVPNPLGKAVPADRAWDHVFGFLLFNDWSARDIQQWEYVPLGPFLGKNFASSVSPWIVTADALNPFRVPGPIQDPPVLPYLETREAYALDITLEVSLEIPSRVPVTVSRTNSRYLYWSIAQQIAHHTIGGCNLNIGDLLASGTISGPDPSSYGSMLELAWRGERPILMPDGSTRSFILDGDTVVMRGHAQRDGVRVGFGEVRNEVLE